MALVGGRRRRCTGRVLAGTHEYRPGYWPRGRACRVVPSCAGAYVAGAAGSNDCPAGSVRIEAEAACRTVVTATGKTAAPTFVETFSGFPRGCYYVTATNASYFNLHAVGAGDSRTQLLCAAVTTGAPPHAPLTPTRVHCAVLAGVASYNANGLNIDTHAYIRTHVYIYTYVHVRFRRRSPAVPRGARQRERTADGRARARHVRVLEGYSNTGTGHRGICRHPLSGTCTWVADRYI
jgi:hypothetical protein